MLVFNYKSQQCRNPSFSGTYSLTKRTKNPFSPRNWVAILLLVELILSHIFRKFEIDKVKSVAILLLVELILSQTFRLHPHAVGQMVAILLLVELILSP